MEWVTVGMMKFPIWWESHKIQVPNYRPGTSFFVGGYPTWYPHEITMFFVKSPCLCPAVRLNELVRWDSLHRSRHGAGPSSSWSLRVVSLAKCYGMKRKGSDMIWWVQELLLIFWILERCNICCIYSERQGLSENMEYRWIVCFNQFFMAHKWWFTNLPVDWRIDHLQKVADASLNHGWQLQKFLGLSGCLKNLDPIIVFAAFFSGLSSLSPWTLPFVGDS